MNLRRLSIALLPSIACFALAPIAFGDDTPTKEGDKAKEPGHIMMDHSPGDTKAMNQMKDRKIPVHHTGDAPTAKDPNAPKEHMMMDHSKGDQKSMSRMKDKHVPIHRDGDPTTAKSDNKEHIMMDHSVGDQKSMSRMKDKKVPIHRNGDQSAGENATAPAKTDK